MKTIAFLNFIYNFLHGIKVIFWTLTGACDNCGKRVFEDHMNGDITCFNCGKLFKL